jgi:DNA-binding response OmpR family regulator
MRILLVEDEVMIALHMEDLLADLGHEVETATRLAEALEMAGRVECDFAILDVNLAGAVSFPVADILAERGVPFVFATGYGSAGVTPPYNQRTIMRKPVAQRDLSRAISAARG